MRYLSCLVVILAALAGAIDAQVPVAGRAAVSGRVTDAYGDPVLRARVVVETLTDSNTTRMLAAGETDDRGEYRIGRLSAGEYVIAVLRLDAIVVTPTASFPGAATRGPTKTYYPSASEPSAAEILRLTADQEIDAIDFSLPALPPSLPPVVVARAQAGSTAAPAPSGSAILRGRVVTTDKRAVPVRAPAHRACRRHSANARCRGGCPGAVRVPCGCRRLCSRFRVQAGPRSRLRRSPARGYRGNTCRKR